MLPEMLFIAGIVRAPEQILLMGEVIRRVEDQPVQNTAKCGLPCARLDSAVEFVEKKNQPFVLVVHLLDVHAERI